MRVVLNDLYQQTLEEMDIERLGCQKQEIEIKTRIQTNTDDRVAEAATITMALMSLAASSEAAGP